MRKYQYLSINLHDKEIFRDNKINNFNVLDHRNNQMTNFVCCKIPICSISILKFCDVLYALLNNGQLVRNLGFFNCNSSISAWLRSKTLVSKTSKIGILLTTSTLNSSLEHPIVFGVSINISNSQLVTLTFDSWSIFGSSIIFLDAQSFF